MSGLNNQKSDSCRIVVHMSQTSHTTFLSPNTADHMVMSACWSTVSGAFSNVSPSASRRMGDGSLSRSWSCIRASSSIHSEELSVASVVILPQR